MEFLAISQLNWDGLTQFLEQNSASWTTAIILLFVLLIFFYVGSGLGKTAKGIISVYVALAIVNTVVFFQTGGPEINVPGYFVLKLGAFVGISLVVLMIISRYSFRALIKVDFSGNIVERIIFAALGAGMLIAILMSFMPGEIVGTINPALRWAFMSDIGFSIWLVAPIIAFMFVKKRD